MYAAAGETKDGWRYKPNWLNFSAALADSGRGTDAKGDYDMTMLEQLGVPKNTSIGRALCATRGRGSFPFAGHLPRDYAWTDTRK
jgi:hypothetical protein